MATVTASYNWVSGETVTPTKLNSTASPTVVVADNEVTTAKILDANVTTAKIADANVTAAKLASNAVETAKIADGAVTNAKLADGSVVQVLQGSTTTVTLVSGANSAHYIDPDDGTTPQNTQGVELVTQAITPKSSTNKVLVRAICPFAGPSSFTPVMTMFRGSSASAIAVTWASISGALVGNMVLEFLDSPATTSPVTYRIRIGRGGAGGWYANGGTDGSAKFNGRLATTLTLTEVKAS